MIKEEIAPGIVVYSNVIPDGENLYLDIEEAMASCEVSWEPSLVVEKTNNAGVNKYIRDTMHLDIPYKGGPAEIDTNVLPDIMRISLNNTLFEHCHPIEQDYLSSMGVSWGWHDQYQVLKYGQGGHFTEHIDDHPMYPRRTSTLYYLNDNYSGGEINFPRFNLSFKPKANQMILFPSTYVYNHSVSPVLDGERYVVVSWMF
jgi:hypothetical protein